MSQLSPVNSAPHRREDKLQGGWKSPLMRSAWRCRAVESATRGRFWLIAHRKSHDRMQRHKYHQQFHNITWRRHTDTHTHSGLSTADCPAMRLYGLCTKLVVLCATASVRPGLHWKARHHSETGVWDACCGGEMLFALTRHTTKSAEDLALHHLQRKVIRPSFLAWVFSIWLFKCPTIVTDWNTLSASNYLYSKPSVWIIYLYCILQMN